MTLKTFADCSKCEFLITCDMHISHGTHKHSEGPDPCEFVIIQKQNQGSEKPLVDHFL